MTTNQHPALGRREFLQASALTFDVAADGKVAEADGVLALTKDPKNLTCAAVIGGRPADAGFADYINRYKDDKRVIGVRQVLHGDDTKAGYCLEKEFVKSVQLLG